MSRRIPWWGLIGAKLILSRLPAGYSIWRRLNLFAHGAMHRSDYALRVFRRHFANYPRPAGSGFVALELGPGDSLASAVIAAAHGATLTHLVDAGEFATADMAVYRELARYLREQGMAPPDVDGAADVRELLRICRGSYGTDGLASLRKIPSGSVDFIWSNAVLEHVRRHEFLDFMRETRRILRPGGVCSHQVDLKDHLGGALNNLRISSRWWEAGWMARSGFYTNRLRQCEIVNAMQSAGFAVSVKGITRWERPPIPRRALAREFQGFDAAELSVSGFEVILTVA